MTMDDARIWGSEERLWTGNAETYRATVDEECLMVLPSLHFVMSGAQAVAKTPRWTKVELSKRQVSRPQEGLIVIAYKAVAERDGVSPYEAHCTTTYLRLAHEEWRVVQHQQTPPLIASP